jgi:hypothetical protein
MRLIVIKEPTDLSTLAGTLLRKGTPPDTVASTLDRVKALNPHVDPTRLDAGTVLLLPDAPAIAGNVGNSPGRDAFKDFGTDVTAGFTAAARAVSASIDAVTSNRTAVAAVLKTAGVRRLIDSDPALKLQVDTATAQFDVEKQQATDAVKQFESLRKRATDELAVLAKLFR